MTNYNRNTLQLKQILADNSEKLFKMDVTDSESRLHAATGHKLVLSGDQIKLVGSGSTINDVVASIDNLNSSVAFIQSNTDAASLDSLTELLTAFQDADSSLQTLISNNTTSINGLQTNMTTAQTDISGLQTQVTQMNNATHAGSLANKIKDIEEILSAVFTNA